MDDLKERELKKRLLDELAKIDGDPKLLPEVNTSNGDGNPYIEIDRYGYNYVCNDRGKELFRKLPFDIDELVYEVLKDVTSAMASKWGVKNRKEGEDPRRQLFAKQVELMGKIRPDFGQRIEKELQWFLRQAPFEG
jgi:hypothetical protein